MDAIYNGSKQIRGILCVTLTAVAVNVGVQLYYTDRTSLDAVDPPSLIAQVGTTPSFTKSQGFREQLLPFMCIVNGLSCLTCHLRIVSSDMACLWIGIFVFDLCILCLTLWKTYYTYKDGYMSGGLLTIVMRDGLMYFGIITLASLANIVVFLLGGEFTRGLLPVFTNM
ncbi:hypothetical protein EV361DRAFT_105475 [Lentinula raphanica]|nr:hypothetical protein EV361DRAFT_105475 [Lentinula raphanica]